MKKLIAMTLTIALLLGLLTIPAAAITPGSWDIPGGVYKEIMKKVTAEEKAKQEAEEDATEDAKDESAEEVSESATAHIVETEGYPPAVSYKAWNWDGLWSRWR